MISTASAASPIGNARLDRRLVQMVTHSAFRTLPTTSRLSPTRHLSLGREKLK